MIAFSKSWSEHPRFWIHRLEFTRFQQSPWWFVLNRNIAAAAWETAKGRR